MEDVDDANRRFQRKLQMNNLIAEVSAQFKKLKTNRERLLFLYNNDLLYSILADAQPVKKNNDIAEEYRKKGNREYINKNFVTALEFYNKCIAYAELETDRRGELIYAYSNRSAVLYEMNYMNECLQDIETVLKENCPDNLKPKLKLRQKKAERSLTSSRVFKNFSEMPKFSYEPHSKISCAGNCLEIVNSQEFGYYVVATCDLSPGEVISIEKPYIAVLKEPHFYTHCNCCLSRCLNLIGCLKCPTVMFCSVECRDMAWEEFHQFECPILSTVLAINVGLMAGIALRCTIKARHHFVELKKQNFKLNMFTEENNRLVYKIDTYNAVHNSEAHTDKRDLVDIFSKAVRACALMKLLENHTDFLELDILSKTEMKEVTAELLLLHLQTAPINGRVIGEHIRIGDKAQGFQQLSYGSSIESFGRLYNHSCTPNTFHTYYGTYFVVRVLRPIKKGEQIYTTYGPYYGQMPKTDRQVNLKRRYFFNCRCEACVDNWPVNLPFKCPASRKLSSQAFIPLFNGDVEEANGFLPDLLEASFELEKHRPSRELLDIHEKIKEYYALLGNKFVFP